MMDNYTKLDELAEARAMYELQHKNYDADMTIVMETVNPALAAIAERWQPRLDETAARIAALEAEVRFDVLQFGATQRGAHLMAVWVKGRTSWDAKALDGYSAAHPEIERFRKVGEPSVTIRSV